VLYIKPANTYAQDGDVITLPADITEVQVGATLGVVFARRATRLSETEALDVVAGYRVVADLSVPHASYFRPALKQQCRDGFCPIGRDLAPASAIANPDALDIEVWVDGVVAQRASTADLVRPVARLIADVTQFMSFEAGDMLLVGTPHDAPRLRAGQRYDIRIAQVGTLGNALAAATV
jgi:5-oxopent-3-ene-1,2,5-tricarboxylate decarboxylase/2-hydroxyhepta-2,4-diene-1,7-dioate isomerase